MWHLLALLAALLGVVDAAVVVLQVLVVNFVLLVREVESHLVWLLLLAAFPRF